MFGKNLFIVFSFLASFFLVGCQQGGDVTADSEEEKVLYSLGAIFAQRLEHLELSEREADLLLQGLRDQVTGQELQVEPEEYQTRIAEVLQGRIEGRAQAEKEKGQSYLQNFLENEGGQQTDTGLAYKIDEEGEGNHPSPEDIVEVSYEGRLIDGTVFDASESPVTFPLNRVVAGWTEGLQKLRPGGKMTLVIPSDLAYGDNGVPPQIPGGATLVFDVELHSVSSAEDYE